MNCKKCGYPLFSNDKVCKRCGEEVVRESDIPTVTTEEKIPEVPIAPVINNDGMIPDPTMPIVDPTKPIVDPTQQEEKKPIISNGAPIPELAVLDAPPKVFEEPSADDENIVPIVPTVPQDPKEAPIPDLSNGEVKTDNINEVSMPVVEETTFGINNVSIPDPTQQVENKQEEVKEVSLPQINNGPIEPVVNTDDKKNGFDSSYDKIEGIKSLNNIMSMGNTQQEFIPQDMQINVPSIPNDKKSTSSVIIPTKPKPIGSTSTNINPMNKQEMDSYQQQMNNYDESMNKEENNEQDNVDTSEKKNIKKPIIIILVLILLGVGGYFGYKYLVDNGIIGGKVKTQSVDFNSYKFEVPEKYKTQINTNNLVVYDDTNILAFAFINGSYNDFSQALTLENFNSLGNQATYLGEKQQDGHKYHLYKVLVGEKNAYVGYVSVSEIKIVCFSVEPKTGSQLPSDDYLKEAIKIAISATFSGSTNTVMESSGTNELVDTGTQAVIGEEESAGDINDEPEYEDTYVNITLNEINE